MKGIEPGAATAPSTPIFCQMRRSHLMRPMPRAQKGIRSLVHPSDSQSEPGAFFK